MNIFVCIKPVPDTESKINISEDGSSIRDNDIKWIMNPYDELAVEEALQLKTSQGGQVKVLSLGPKKRSTDVLRTALAMGADEGILINAPDNLDAFATAKALSKAIKLEGEYDQIFTGKMAIDNNNSSVTQMLAEFLNIPHAVPISKFQYDNASVTVERETEGGTKEIIQLNGANVIGANKGLNKPRYASLPGIMKAKKKPLKELELEALEHSPEDIKIIFKGLQLPPPKPPIKMIDGDAAEQANKLALLLREEAKVI